MRTDSEKVAVFRQSMLIALLCAIVSSVAVAQSPVVADLVAKAMSTQPDARHGAVLYAKHCTSCHGGKAWGNGLKEVPSLAGQREIYLVTQLAQFATQERNGSAMHRATSAADVNHPQAIRDLAAHLSRAPANPRPEQGDGNASAAGEKLFQRGVEYKQSFAARGSRRERK